MPTIAARTALQSLVACLVDAWNRADGDRYASAFTADADFTAITGLRVIGRDLIAAGHNEILSTIYKGSVLSSEVTDVRLIRPDVASAQVAFRFSEPRMGISATSCGLIAVREGSVWKIAVFRNMVPHGRPMAGPLERQIMAEAHV